MFYFRERERGGVYGCVDVLIFCIYVYYNLNFIFVKCFFWNSIWNMIYILCIKYDMLYKFSYIIWFISVLIKCYIDFRKKDIDWIRSRR